MALAQTGAAYAAKRVGSEVLVAGRTLAAVRQGTLAPETDLERGLVPLLDIRVDRAAGVVEVGVGPLRRRAALRPGFGVTLVPVGHGALPALPVLEPMPALAEAPWPSGDGPFVPPKDPVFDADVLRRTLDAAMAEPEGDGPRRRTRALLVVHRGRLVAERYGPGVDANTPLEGWSMAKSVLSALVGIRIGQGGLALDQSGVLASWRAAGDPRREIELGDLLRMESGLTWTEDYGDVGGDVASLLFRQPSAGGFASERTLAVDPGTQFRYSSGTSNIVSLVLRRSFERDDDYWRFPRQALFGPLGMRSAIFEVDPSGTFVGSSFLWATARDWARFGLLFAQDGMWNDTRVLPSGWVAASATPSAASKGRYGLHWWLNRGPEGDDSRRQWPDLPADLFWADGFEGQMVAVFPSDELVVVRLGCTKDGRLFRQGDLLRSIRAAFVP